MKDSKVEGESSLRTARGLSSSAVRSPPRGRGGSEFIEAPHCDKNCQRHHYRRSVFSCGISSKHGPTVSPPTSPPRNGRLVPAGATSPVPAGATMAPKKHKVLSKLHLDKHSPSEENLGLVSPEKSSTLVSPETPKKKHGLGRLLRSPLKKLGRRSLDSAASPGQDPPSSVLVIQRERPATSPQDSSSEGFPSQELTPRAQDREQMGQSVSRELFWGGEVARLAGPGASSWAHEAGQVVGENQPGAYEAGQQEVLEVSGTNPRVLALEEYRLEAENGVLMQGESPLKPPETPDTPVSVLPKERTSESLAQSPSYTREVPVGEQFERTSERETGGKERAVDGVIKERAAALGRMQEADSQEVGPLQLEVTRGRERAVDGPFGEEGVPTESAQEAVTEGADFLRKESGPIPLDERKNLKSTGMALLEEAKIRTGGDGATEEGEATIGSDALRLPDRVLTFLHLKPAPSAEESKGGESVEKERRPAFEAEPPLSEKVQRSEPPSSEKVQRSEPVGAHATSSDVSNEESAEGKHCLIEAADRRLGVSAEGQLSGPFAQEAVPQTDAGVVRSEPLIAQHHVVEQLEPLMSDRPAEAGLPSEEKRSSEAQHFEEGQAEATGRRGPELESKLPSGHSDAPVSLLSKSTVPTPSLEREASERTVSKEQEGACEENVTRGKGTYIDSLVERVAAAVGNKQEVNMEEVDASQPEIRSEQRPGSPGSTGAVMEEKNESGKELHGEERKESAADKMEAEEKEASVRTEAPGLMDRTLAFLHLKSAPSAQETKDEDLEPGSEADGHPELPVHADVRTPELSTEGGVQEGSSDAKEEVLPVGHCGAPQAEDEAERPVAGSLRTEKVPQDKESLATAGGQHVASLEAEQKDRASAHFPVAKSRTVEKPQAREQPSVYAEEREPEAEFGQWQSDIERPLAAQSGELENLDDPKVKQQLSAYLEGHVARKPAAEMQAESREIGQKEEPQAEELSAYIGGHVASAGAELNKNLENVPSEISLVRELQAERHVPKQPEAAVKSTADFPPRTSERPEPFVYGTGTPFDAFDEEPWESKKESHLVEDTSVEHQQEPSSDPGRGNKARTSEAQGAAHPPAHLHLDEDTSAALESEPSSHRGSLDEPRASVAHSAAHSFHEMGDQLASIPERTVLSDGPQGSHTAEVGSPDNWTVDHAHRTAERSVAFASPMTLDKQAVGLNPDDDWTDDVDELLDGPDSVRPDGTQQAEACTKREPTTNPESQAMEEPQTLQEFSLSEFEDLPAAKGVDEILAVPKQAEGLPGSLNGAANKDGLKEEIDSQEMSLSAFKAQQESEADNEIQAEAKQTDGLQSYSNQAANGFAANEIETGDEAQAPQEMSLSDFKAQQESGAENEIQADPKLRKVSQASGARFATGEAFASQGRDVANEETDLASQERTSEQEHVAEASRDSEARRERALTNLGGSIRACEEGGVLGLGRSDREALSMEGRLRKAGSGRSDDKSSIEVTSAGRRSVTWADGIAAETDGRRCVADVTESLPALSGRREEEMTPAEENEDPSSARGFAPSRLLAPSGPAPHPAMQIAAVSGILVKAAYQTTVGLGIITAQQCKLALKLTVSRLHDEATGLVVSFL